MPMTIEKQIRDFIIENFLFGTPDNGLEDTDSLLDKGIIDSTGVLELVSHLEETYSIQVEDEELIPDNLDSIVAVTNYIQRKQSEAQ
jgi:acyl carrier protein